MTRIKWFIAEVLAGMLISGIITALAVPALMQAGREPDGRLMWGTIAVSVVAAVAIGERVRARRRLSRVS